MEHIDFKVTSKSEKRNSCNKCATSKSMSHHRSKVRSHRAQSKQREICPKWVSQTNASSAQAKLQTKNNKEQTKREECHLETWTVGHTAVRPSHTTSRPFGKSTSPNGHPTAVWSTLSAQRKCWFQFLWTRSDLNSLERIEDEFGQSAQQNRSYSRYIHRVQDYRSTIS